MAMMKSVFHYIKKCGLQGVKNKDEGDPSRLTPYSPHFLYGEKLTSPSSTVLKTVPICGPVFMKFCWSPITMCVKLASDSDSYSASSTESLENVKAGQFGDREHEYDINFALAGIPYPLIVP